MGWSEKAQEPKVVNGGRSAQNWRPERVAGSSAAGRPAGTSAAAGNRARARVPCPFNVASGLRTSGRPLPLRLARQPIRRPRHPAQPRHIRLRVVPAHARHRVPIRLLKAGIPPRTTSEAIIRADSRRRRERPILAHRHLVAAQRQPAVRQHNQLRTHVAVPEHIARTTRRIASRRQPGDRGGSTDRRASSRRRPGAANTADFAEVDHRFRGCGSRISVKWSAHRSVATFVGQLPPIGVVASGRYPTRAVVSVSIEEVACGSCGRRVRRPRCCGKRAFGDGAVAAERIARVFHGTARIHRLFAPGGSVGRLADVIVMSSPSGGWRVRRACVASSGP